MSHKTSNRDLTFDDVQKNYTKATADNIDGIKLTYRSNLPTEIHIVKSVFIGREYQRKGLILSKEDVVLDLGGNIGAFALSAFKQVKKVISVEPETVNFDFLTFNKKQNKASNIKLVRAAVVGNEDKARTLYLGKTPYYYSFLVKRGRQPVEVPCINVNELIKKYDPTKLKVDIEGSEWEVLTAIQDFGRVNQIVFEYNFDMNGDLKSDSYCVKFKKLKAWLKKHRFNTKTMDRDIKQNWNLVFLVERS